MNDDELYTNFRDGITNDKLNKKLNAYAERLEDIYSDGDIQRGLEIGSKIRNIAQDVLFELGAHIFGCHH